MSKSSKTKLTDLHYIGDKNYSESKLSQKAIILLVYIRKKSVYKLLFGHVQISETQCSYIIIKTYESTISIIQLYHLAKLRE